MDCWKIEGRVFLEWMARMLKSSHEEDGGSFEPWWVEGVFFLQLHSFMKASEAKRINKQMDHFSSVVCN